MHAYIYIYIIHLGLKRLVSINSGNTRILSGERPWTARSEACHWVGTQSRSARRTHLKEPQGRGQGVVKRSTGHTYTHRQRTNTPDTHAHDKNNTSNPQTNTSHKYLTTLEGIQMQHKQHIANRTMP